MAQTEQQPDSISAMAFYHEDGFVPAFNQAQRFAGKKGRLATLPDIIHARLATKPGDVPWEKYFTTLSAEYVGRTRGGNRILIVAHGVGPMSTLKGILAAYSFHFKDKTRDRRGGRISKEEFLDLESGKYGEVSIVDLEIVFKSYGYPFIEILTHAQALFAEITEEGKKTLLEARLGPEWVEYFERHTDFAREWHRKQAGVYPENRYKLPDWQRYLNRRGAFHLVKGREMSNPYIIKMGGAANCPYGASPADEERYGRKLVFPLDRDGLPIAHLLAIGGLMHTHHEGRESLVSDVDCHEWWNGVRLVGIRGDGKLSRIHPGADDLRSLLLQNRDSLMLPNAKRTSAGGFYALMQVAENVWFTMYPKHGHEMDSWEPEFRVTALETIGDPVEFQTKISGHHMFFRYDAKEVHRLAPLGANAYYTVGEPAIVEDGDPKYHRATLQFCRAQVDTSRRLMREAQLRNDYNLVMKMVER